MEQKYQHAGRDQYIAGVQNFNNFSSESSGADRSGNGSDAPGGAEGNGEGTPGGGGTRSGGWGGAGIIIAIVVIALLYGISQGSSQASQATVAFPAKSNPWPAGVSANAVMQPVVNRLEACAQAPVLAPVNCPQSQASSGADVTDVQWGLHGDAGNGAKIVFWKDRFYVGGNAVMAVAFSDDGNPQLAVQVVHYRAQVTWQNGTATLTSIEGVSSASGPVITKSQPSVPWNSVQKAVLSAFEECASATSAPLPPQCPTEQSISDDSSSSARWDLTANPLPNSQESFDSSSGLIHVTGSFALSVTYHEFLIGEQHDLDAGNYNAVVSIDGTKIVVLQITGS
jgi:hypothetical protein